MIFLMVVLAWDNPASLEKSYLLVTIAEGIVNVLA